MEPKNEVSFSSQNSYQKIRQDTFLSLQNQLNNQQDQNNLIQEKNEEILDTNQVQIVQKVLLSQEDEKIYQIGQIAIQKLQENYQLDSQWTLIQRFENDFTNHQKKDKMSGYLIARGEGIFQFDSKKIFWLTLNKRKIMIKILKMEKLQRNLIIQSFLMKQLIYYKKYKAIFPVSSRDLSIVSASKQIDNKIFIAALSCESNLVPLVKSCVRAEIIVAGWVFEILNENQTKAIYISCVDPKGNIPKKITDLVSKGQGQIPYNINQFLEKINKK